MPTISFGEALCCAAGIGGACILNLTARKPMMTGIYKHAVLGVGGFYLGTAIDTWNNNKRREKLLILEDYVKQHPEDFPELEPKKYKDLLVPWSPVR
ncbi:NADH dehydrogenase [ubiquinone] 1 subunit C2-like [Haliotis rufescens]|uniref:NADH dehydrogenase [ubiquinone] 1 subunit C2-like n=1 Tax=Haliotis rufescens TaxID=6454 RepID=UPI00201ED539|nr:NADH dehydrogenase [ubiquinone] 1 subunit C2-like [Haliotis rufescens]